VRPWRAIGHRRGDCDGRGGNLPGGHDRWIVGLLHQAPDSNS